MVVMNRGCRSRGGLVSITGQGACCLRIMTMPLCAECTIIVMNCGATVQRRRHLRCVFWYYGDHLDLDLSSEHRQGKQHVHPSMGEGA